MVNFVRKNQIGPYSHLLIFIRFKDDCFIEEIIVIGRRKLKKILYLNFRMSLELEGPGIAPDPTKFV